MGRIFKEILVVTLDIAEGEAIQEKLYEKWGIEDE
ncbi:hypothetical protein B0P06_001692 [Clostridium saccharoperbutylacetonicum]|nr:hypothetical protein [Clostridium saccharoperbutylacetonicum]NSB28433.1 hypothetical protein [Clostridium saccharoperbutylacetonicum]NSB41921.1 hypothetical protein [Clostridium saccharoperbutylacetonicum]